MSQDTAPPVRQPLGFWKTVLAVIVGVIICALVSLALFFSVIALIAKDISEDLKDPASDSEILPEPDPSDVATDACMERYYNDMNATQTFQEYAKANCPEVGR